MCGGFEYVCIGNFIWVVLEVLLVVVEEGVFVWVFSFGMVVIDCVLWVMLWFGDYVVIFDDVYGGIFWLIDKVFIWWDV